MAHEWENIRNLYGHKLILLGLERVRQVWLTLGGQPPPIVIAVAGTNGKGSCCLILDSILRRAGYRVGLYTSPHLFSFRERICIDGMAVSDEMLNLTFHRVATSKGAESLTQFELDTLVAVSIFNQANVDVGILEVGLGGRLDAVNVFDSDCAIVTSVDIDHTDYLGDTREKIAYEKAGIFRAGKVAVFGAVEMPEAIANEAKRIGAELWQLGKEFEFEASSHTLSQSQGERELKQWNFRGVSGARNSLPYPALCGVYQLNNASTALAALDALKNILPLSMSAVHRGLIEVRLPGRFQVLPGKPQIILDVAHNPHAAHALAQNLAALAPARTFAVFAMLKDKDIARVVRELNDQIDVWLLADIAAPRGATAAELALVLAKEGLSGEVRKFPSITFALRHACNEAGENDRITAFGSFYTVAEVMQARGMCYD